MTTGTIHGGGHIDTPFPEKSVVRRPTQAPLDTPDTNGPPAEATTQPRIWLVKQRVNPYFCGRDCFSAFTRKFRRMPSVSFGARSDQARHRQHWPMSTAHGRALTQCSGWTRAMGSCSGLISPKWPMNWIEKILTNVASVID